MVADLRYTRHFVTTRKAAARLALVAFAALLPFLAMRVDLSRPLPAATLVILAFMPLMVSYHCLHFLAKLERQHDTPTPEMSFIFNLAVGLPIAFTAVLLITLNHYE
jgi:hypothetical protein